MKQVGQCYRLNDWLNLVGNSSDSVRLNNWLNFVGNSSDSVRLNDCLNLVETGRTVLDSMIG
jgi:hypothetical protein